MFSLPGAPALSQFRLERLLQALQGVDPRVRALGSRLIHFVDAARRWTKPSWSSSGSC